MLRKVNNIGWVVVGLIGGMLLLLLFISPLFLDETSIDLTPDQKTDFSIESQSSADRVLRILFISSENEFQIDNEVISAPDLPKALEAQKARSDNLVFILRVDERSQHKKLIEAVDMLKSAEIEHKLEIVKFPIREQ